MVVYQCDRCESINREPGLAATLGGSVVENLCVRCQRTIRAAMFRGELVCVNETTDLTLEDRVVKLEATLNESSFGALARLESLSKKLDDTRAEVSTLMEARTRAGTVKEKIGEFTAFRDNQRAINKRLANTIEALEAKSTITIETRSCDDPYAHDAAFVSTEGELAHGREALQHLLKRDSDAAAFFKEVVAKALIRVNYDDHVNVIADTLLEAVIFDA